MITAQLLEIKPQPTLISSNNSWDLSTNNLRKQNEKHSISFNAKNKIYSKYWCFAGRKEHPELNPHPGLSRQNLQVFTTQLLTLFNSFQADQVEWKWLMVIVLPTLPTGFFAANSSNKDSIGLHQFWSPIPVLRTNCLGNSTTNGFNFLGAGMCFLLSDSFSRFCGGTRFCTP